jgi:hypothetical protein
VIYITLTPEFDRRWEGFLARDGLFVVRVQNYEVIDAQPLRTCGLLWEFAAAGVSILSKSNGGASGVTLRLRAGRKLRHL